MEIFLRWNWKCFWLRSYFDNCRIFKRILGSGTLWGIAVLGDPIDKTGLYSIGYENNGFMLLSPMALIVVGIIIWVQRARSKHLIEDKWNI